MVSNWKCMLSKNWSSIVLQVSSSDMIHELVAYTHRNYRILIASYTLNLQSVDYC